MEAEERERIEALKSYLAKWFDRGRDNGNPAMSRPMLAELEADGEAQAQAIFKAGKEEQLKEVVEWMKGHILRCETERGIAYIQDIILFRFTKEEWQAFLKERGLEK